MSKLTVFTLLAAMFLSLGCATGPIDGLINAQNLEQRSFVLVMVDGQKFSSQVRQPYISFAENMKISGRICNNFVGQAVLQDNILSAPNLASTRMLCVEESVNQLETWLGMMLQDGAQISLDGPQLTLEGQGHVLLFEEQK